MRPVIGITTDVHHPEGRPESLRSGAPLTYARAVAAAGGTSVLLPPLVESIPDQLRLCAGFVLTGGDDPRTEPFGEPTHPRAEPVHEVRQRYETALLEALEAHRDIPVLGICLGMQMMALAAGGKLNQHLPDTVKSASEHAADSRHAIEPSPGAACSVAKLLRRGTVTSRQHQGVEHPGSLEVVARAHDGVIEAVGDAARAFYLGVQWHPERTDDDHLGLDLFRALVQAAGARTGENASAGARR